MYVSKVEKDKASSETGKDREGSERCDDFIRINSKSELTHRNVGLT